MKNRDEGLRTGPSSPRSHPLTFRGRLTTDSFKEGPISPTRASLAR